jgi:hypothetical protein
LLIVYLIKPDKVAIELVIGCSLGRDGRGADCALVAVECYPIADMEFINHRGKILYYYFVVNYFLSFSPNIINKTTINGEIIIANINGTNIINLLFKGKRVFEDYPKPLFSYFIKNQLLWDATPHL